MLTLLSIGPGALDQMTLAAQSALKNAETVIGYSVYIDLVQPLLAEEQEIIAMPMGSEMERARHAIKLAQTRRVALISSGDIGIYAMAAPVFEALQGMGWNGTQPQVEVLPGISAFQAAAARLGAPVNHDFCAISLSDLLTPWEVIEKRLQAAAWGDFVVAIYNPRSKGRDWQLGRALEILLTERPPDTPAAILRNVTRADEQVHLTTLGALNPTDVDMFSLVMVGSSQSYTLGVYMATPRGYMQKSP